jgi:hypothetical protein
MIRAMDLADQRLGELILYAAKASENDASVGAVKLNKILYFAEFAHVRTTGRPITGARYQKLAQGPAPRRLLPVRDYLIEEGSARLDHTTYLGNVQDHLVALRGANLDLLEPGAKESVDEVVQWLWGRTGGEVTRLSHEEPGWKMVELQEDIPFSTAYLPQEFVLTPTATAHAEELAARLSLK